MTRRRKPAASLRERALGIVRKRILDLHYPPGSLLSENQLAEELGISRTPVREALRELATSGLVRILPQRGVEVSEPSVQDIVEVYQLREQLEGFAARVTAEHLTQADAQILTADHADALSHFAAGRLQEAYEFSVRLHARIIALTRNSRLVKFMDQLADQVHRFGLMTLRHGRAASALAEHGRIIDAILARDGATAETLMRDHLRADRDVALEAVLPKDLPPAAADS
ncbi:GntR family transcriptional regulator [Elioraea sp. Yellowstone]|uniref:GntR family transcriptional regulator n=1 Tax=Elioraea sp. Yellowstone TaxID=2592070 RepID=UPI0013871168|nr:GntR family transcriptional regulator [Elioraea sp. Yellowstone]